MLEIKNKTAGDFEQPKPIEKIDNKKFSEKFINHKNSKIKEWILTIIYAVVFSVAIKSFFYENYKIPSGSMMPTLLSGDRILVNKYQYGYTKYSFPFGHYFNFNDRFFNARKPQYGDVVVFAGTQQHNKNIFYIKRIIGLPNDEIRIENGDVIVNGKRLDYEFTQSLNGMTGNNQNIFEVKEYLEKAQNGIEYRVFIANPEAEMQNTTVFKVPENHYFCMGDNRDNSKDSRFEDMGFIPFENIVGRATTIMFSFSNKNAFLNINKDRFWKNINIL